MDVFKWPILGLFYDLFLVFSNKHYIFLQYNMKKMSFQPVSSDRIQTHDLFYVSLLP